MKLRLYQVGNHETQDFLAPTSLVQALGQYRTRLANQHAEKFETKFKGGLWRQPRGLLRTMAQVSRLAKNAKLGEAIWTRDTKNNDPVFVIRPVIVNIEDFPEHSTYTTQCKVVWNNVMLHFDGLVSWGIFVCKEIAGTNSWSQHSWGNAIDFHGSAKKMDQLAEYLRRNAKRLNIANVIHDRKISYNGEAWRYYDGENPHYDHVHVDFLPQKEGTPPCA